MKKKVLCLMLLASLLYGCSEPANNSEVNIMNDTGEEIVEKVTGEDLSSNEDERYFHKVDASMKKVIGTWESEDGIRKIELKKDGSFYMCSIVNGERYKTETYGTYTVGTSGEDDPNVLWESINIDVEKILNASGKDITNEGFDLNPKYYIESLDKDVMELRIDSTRATKLIKTS